MECQSESICDTTFGQIVRAHFDSNSIAHDYFDFVLAQSAVGVAGNNVLIFQSNTKHIGWQYFRDGAFHLN